MYFCHTLNIEGNAKKYTNMADEVIKEKIYCNECGGNSAPMWAALMRDNDNGWNNNPFAYLIWLMAMRWLGNGDGWGGNQAENYNSRQIAALQDVVNTNHNNDLAIQAIQGNGAAIAQLAQTYNASQSLMQNAVAGVKSAVEMVAGQVGMSGERVINSVLLGNKDLTQALQTCCCENKVLALQNANAAQLQAATNQAATISRIDQLANGIQSGFAQVGYATQAQTCDIINAGNANTQRIIDTLNNHWSQDLQIKYNDAKLELSQLNQNATLIAALKTT